MHSLLDSESIVSLRQEVKKNQLQFWQAVVLIGSFFSGLGIPLILQEILSFEYHSYKGTVGFAALRLYPEQREFYLYLLTLLIVPIMTSFGYFLWFNLAALQQKICAIPPSEQLKLTAFSYFIWFLVPLLLYAPYRNEDFLLSPIVFTLGLTFVGVNLVVPFFYKDYGEKRDLLLVHLGVFLLGACPGLFLLAMPGTPSSGPSGYPDPLNFPETYSFWIVLMTGALTWLIWLVFSHLVARRALRSSQEVLPRTALVFLPLAILPLETLSWAEYIQDGKATIWYQVPGHRAALILLTLIASLIIGIWAVYGLLHAARYPFLPTISDQKTTAHGQRTTDRPARLFSKIFFWGALPLLIYALFFQVNIQKDLDFFHEGEKLAPAQALLQGKSPYKEIFFIHGLFEDPGIALTGFKLFGKSVEGYRLLEAIVSPLAILSYYYLGLLCLPYEEALLLVGLILTGLFPVLSTDRVLIANLSLLFAVAYLRYERSLYLFITAFTAFLGFLVATDTGFAVIFAQIGLWLFMGFSQAKGEGTRSLSPWKPAFIYGSCLLMSSLPFILYLMKADALGSFFSTYREIFRAYDHWSSLPLKGFILGIHDQYEFWESYFIPLLILVTLIFLRFKPYPPRWRSEDWILVLLLFINIVYFKRGLDRSDAGHTLMGSHFGWILLLFLLTELIRADKKYALICLFLVGLLFIPTPTLREGKTTLPAQLEGFSRKNSIDITGRVSIPAPRLGQLFLPPEQADATLQMLQFFAERTRSDDYIWDFTNHGAFYFLTDRRNPTRYPQAYHIITEEQQREVIRDLQRHAPKFVIFRSQTHFDEMDGVDNYLRHYLLSDYLLHHYKPSAQVANFTLLEPGSIRTIEEPYRQYLFRPIDFGYVPFLWGRERYEQILSKDRMLMEWKLSEKPMVTDWAVEIDPELVTYLIVNMKADRGKRVQLFWTAHPKEFSRGNSLLFSLRSDGAFHPYIFRLSSLPGWVWVDKVTGLRLIPVDEGGSVELESIKLIQEVRNES